MVFQLKKNGQLLLRKLGVEYKDIVAPESFTLAMLGLCQLRQKNKVWSPE